VNSWRPDGRPEKRHSCHRQAWAPPWWCGAGGLRPQADERWTCAAKPNTGAWPRYDDAAGRRPAGPGPAPPTTPGAARDAEDKRGTFLIKPYRPTYILLGRITNSANRLPSSPGPDRSVTEPLDVSPVEAKYQISFKTKLWEGLFGRHGDLWMGYTQQSNWQVYNKSNSSPFRETNYEPELMAVFRTNLDAGAGFKVKMLSVGFNHQSNGRAEPLSRSWNRLTAQVGIERGDFALVLRPWYRFPEKDGKDDNPDIGRYLGYGDVQAMWKLGDHGLGLTCAGPCGRAGAGARPRWTGASPSTAT
jgi:phospholipase A1